MNRSAAALLAAGAFLPAGALLLAACALTGATSRQTVALAPPPAGRPLVPIAVVSVAADPEAGLLKAAGTYEWGMFDGDDLANIRGSLEDSLKAASSRAPVEGAGELRLQLVLHRYLVATSNVSADVLAAVTWCASDSLGRAIYRETFYAADSARFVGTLGGVKDAVHRHIVRRVAESALILAGGIIPAAALPRRVAGTYEDFQTAAAGMPERIRSWGMFTLSPVFYRPGTAYETVPWWQVEMAEPASCELPSG